MSRAAAKTPAAKKGKPSAKKGEQRSKLELLGIDGLCERIEKGESVGQIADSLGMHRTSAWEWIKADDQRSARVRASLEASASEYDDQAEKVLKDLVAASTPAEVARARELASHYRWRASKRNPKAYGDKLDLNHSGKVEMTDEQVQTRLTLLIAKTKVGNEGDTEA